MSDAKGGRRPEIKKIEAPRSRTIFVGGGLDDVYGHNTLDYSKNFKKNGGDAEYYIHWRGGDIVKAIERANREGIRPDLVGHSWGGTSAYNAAREAQKRGLAIRELVTVDPVGTFMDSDTEFHPQNVGKWVTVRAIPDKPDVSDGVARVGWGKPKGREIDADGRWPSHVPEQRADRMTFVKRNHRDFAGMMDDAGIADDLRKPSPYSAERPKDESTVGEWMRTRWKGLAGR